MNKIDKNRIYIFIAFSFGIAWLTALVIFLTGGLVNSPVYNFAGIQLSLAMILLATIYMFSPAIANLLTRIVTKEGNANLMLKPKFKQGGWQFYLAAWVLPGLLTIFGLVLYFLIFPQYYDSELTLLTQQMIPAGMEAINPWMIVVAQTIQAILLAPLLNAIPTFGEEFGWRGYLQPKLMPLGAKKALLITGIIWGVWHWPIILMGHNYGLEYFGAPILGPLAMVWFCIIFSIFFGWVTIRTNSVWPAVIGHGAINGIAAIGFLFVRGNPDMLLGPSPAGLVGGLGFTILAVILIFSSKALEPQHKNLDESEPA